MIVVDLVWIVVISVAAHVSVAWSAIAYHTRRAERKWTHKVETEMIPNAASAASKAVLDALPEIPSEERIRELISETALDLDRVRAAVDETVTAQVGPIIERIDRLGEFPSANQLAVALRNEVGEAFSEINWDQLSGLVWARVKEGLAGTGGAALKSADQSAAGEILKQLAAVDLGSPVVNGIWAIVLAQHGPRIVKIFQAAARRIPFLRGAIDETEAPMLEGGDSYYPDQVRS